MATAIDVGVLSREQTVQQSSCAGKKRRITNEAGRGLEMLGHAIEYLTDQYVLESKKLSASDPQVEAIHLLMRLNRQIYFECPVLPTTKERLAAFFRAEDCLKEGRGRDWSFIVSGSLSLCLDSPRELKIRM